MEFETKWFGNVFLNIYHFKTRDCVDALDTPSLLMIIAVCFVHFRSLL